ncbi:putative 3-hydroxybutyryl-CoA dehydrogenase [Methylobacterium crusticola]|uniref:3-hydroxybutyryl-CoA dehydrogenase n=1 Tax=Methylobacterium crusticola TaxID=1697972 RepID=A0ABQ4R3S8_9HYPH|nr:FAD-dependent oxidoreductase [Methylobacterium crusticola]GJD51397.1 putative 3-hydroxybutyryl-CoA dehydrogenase [Methylobacterium crusticola]
MNPGSLRRIGVVGAGVIGTGVAHLLAQSGHDVVLVDTAPEALAAARRAIGRNARLYGFLQPRTPPDAVLARITDAGAVEALAGVDFVIENVTEDWEVKRRVHAAIDRAVPEAAPVAANTSAIPITRIAGAGRHPERVIGMHFMNPVPVMPMVEIIRGARSGAAALAAARALVAQAGRHSITVDDSPGFVTNRVMMLMVNEAMFLVHEGVAPARDVDRLFKTCFGHKMGPLETADLIGLDTVLASIETLQGEFADSKYRPCPLLKRMVYAGALGRKSGRGFYEYGDA